MVGEKLRILRDARTNHGPPELLSARKRRHRRAYGLGAHRPGLPLALGMQGNAHLIRGPRGSLHRVEELCSNPASLGQDAHSL